MNSVNDEVVEGFISNQLAARIRNELIKVAFFKITITYEELARKVGLPDKGNALGQALSAPLGEIVKWCIAKGIAPLPALVVRKSGEDKGLPGRGFWEFYGMENSTRTEKEVALHILYCQIYYYWDI